MTSILSGEQKLIALLNDFSSFIKSMGINEACLDMTGFEAMHGSVWPPASRATFPLTHKGNSPILQPQQRKFLSPYLARQVADKIGLIATVGSHAHQLDEVGKLVMDSEYGLEDEQDLIREIRAGRYKTIKE